MSSGQYVSLGQVYASLTHWKAIVGIAFLNETFSITRVFFLLLMVVSIIGLKLTVR